MSIIAIIAGIALIIIVLADAFETIVFPRRVTRRIRLVRVFYRTMWQLWTSLVHALSSRRTPRKLPGLLWTTFTAVVAWVLG